MRQTTWRCMCILDVIEANETYDIICTISEAVTSSNILNYVVPIAHFGECCTVNSYIKLDSYCTTKSTQGSYIENKFKYRLVFPSFYHFKERSSTCGRRIARECNLYCLFESTDTPEIIATEGFIYCSTLCYSCACDTNDSGNVYDSWSKKAYR